MAYHFTKANVSLWLLVFCVFGILSSRIDSVDGQRFCGKVLTDTLTAYCEIFPTPRPSKRRVIEAADFRYALFPNVPPAIDDQPHVVESLHSVPGFKTEPKWMRALFRIKDDANYDKTKVVVDGTDSLSNSDGFQLGKRGVVDDCCYKPCTLQYLLKNYCG
ncbi:uncharacterized protein LOC109403160 [Aedes albopictus]|uniref:Insulin-like domain-containing protein n=1 Tax=Aedes albopictus TaxID=7160 RepID=A0ABM1YMJ7_AEDAL